MPFLSIYTDYAIVLNIHISYNIYEALWDI
jgi:hypothetical protein